jgi:LPXTG-site transpeptidase (sortase) family protein
VGERAALTGAFAPGRRAALAGLVGGALLVVVPVGLWLAGTGPSAAPTVGGPPPAVAPAPVSAPAVTAPATGSTAPVAAPVRIRLDGIGVDAPVVPVGVEPDGDMAVPPDVRTVGWYRFGPGPGGSTGSSVLAGHVDDRVQGRGAFYRLAELTVGQPVLVTLQDGTERRYRVRAVRRIGKQQLPVGQLFDRSGSARLTLITCGGEFDRAARSFQDNVVVSADPG